MAEKKINEKKVSKLGKKDIEKKIVELAKKGLLSEKIGLELKKLGIDFKEVKIGKVLKENNVWEDSDLDNLNNKVDKLRNHFKTHKHDYSSQRALMKKSAKLRKYKKYKKE